MKDVTLKILKVVGILLASILGVVVIAIFVFAIVPEIVVPQLLIKKAISLAPAEAKLSYDKIEIRFVRESLNQKQIRFVLSNVCIDYKEKAIDSCFDELSGGISFTFLMPTIKKVEPLHLLNAYAKIDADRLANDQAKQKKKSNFNVIDFLRKQIFAKWDFPGTLVELKSFELKSGKNRFVSSLFIKAVNEGSTALTLKVPEFKEANKGFPRAKLDFTLQWPNSGSEDYQSNGEINLQPSAKQAIAINLETKSPSWDQIVYDVKAKVNGIAPLNAAELNGRYNSTATEGLLSLQLGGPQSEIKQLNFLNCSYAVNLDRKLGNLNCGPQQVSLALKERPTFKNKPALFKLAPTFQLQVSNFSYDQGAKADLALDLDLNHLNFLTASIKANGKFDSSGKKFKFEAKTDSNIRVSDFKKLVMFLSDTPAAIPAPINAMSGVVNLDVKGGVNDQNGEINFSFKPDLKSQYQRLLFTLGGKVDLDHRAKGYYTKLVLNSNLQNVKISLPRVELKQPPQLVPDKRFALDAKRKKEAVEQKVANSDLGPKSGSTFAYDIDVHTPQVGAIAIATNLTKNPIPVGVNLKADSQSGFGPGKIEIGKTAIELFRRNAFLDELTVNLQPNGEKLLNGKFSVSYLDYDITIKVEGSVDSPKVVMESEPPLSQDQIISVLLFGKAPGELDESQRASVGNVNTAIADAALSFSSLYFLASTPVESVGYDAQRGVVTAKVGLGKGTSLELGSSGQDLAEVGVRRRLGQNIFLNSYVDKDQQTDERTVSAFVEWVKRF